MTLHENQLIIPLLFLLRRAEEIQFEMAVNIATVSKITLKKR